MDEWNGDLGDLAAPIPTAFPTLAPLPSHTGTSSAPVYGTKRNAPTNPVDYQIAAIRKRQRLMQQSALSLSGAVRKETLAKMAPGRRRLGKIKGYLFGELHLEPFAMIDTKVTLAATNDNPGDPMAVKVYPTSDPDIRLGQIDIKIAKVFHKLLESGVVALSGTIIEMESAVAAPVGRYIKLLLVDVSFYGKGSDVINLWRASKEQYLEWSEKYAILRLASGDPVTLQEIADENDPNKKLMERAESDFNQVFDGNELSLEGIDPPQEIIPALKQHQREGLEWMDNRENPGSELPHFIQNFTDSEGERWRNKLTGEISTKPPAVERGGILADDMGLGKTLQAICIILKNRRDEEGYNLGPTLIICPVSVLGNWEQQFREHVEPGSLEIYVYHGRERNDDPEFLASHDVVLSTYDIVSREFRDYLKRKEEGENNEKDDHSDDDFDDAYSIDDPEEELSLGDRGLFHIEWLRLMLDEAHKIRNQNTVKHKACLELNAKVKWALTGTPMQNRLDDIYALFCFVRIQPLTQLVYWRALVQEPIRQGQEVGLKRLRQILSKVCLRRTKEATADISLPPKNEYLVTLDFSPHEQNIYTDLLLSNSQKFDKLDAEGTVLKNYHNVLKMLMRLRQCCAHYLLLPKRENSKSNSSKSDSKNKSEYLEMLKNADQECELCMKSADDPVISRCGHFICCKDCLIFELHNSNNKVICPYCDASITRKSCEALENNEEASIMEPKKSKPRRFSLPPGEISPSTKIQELINKINELPFGGKSVVFSQWTSFLDIVGRCFEQSGIIYERLDGSMTKRKRDLAISNFKTFPDCRAVIMSLKAGNLGLNLTEANTVFMMDPWWNPSAEDQAVDRVYRLGQTEEVNVFRFVIRDSVELKILEIQQRKRLLVRMSMGKKISKEKLQSERLSDLRSLFGSVRSRA